MIHPQEDSAGSPDWASPPRRIARTTSGRPTAPAPWVVLGVGRAWAWDSSKGLLALPDFSDGDARFTMSSLSPDGRHLSYATKPERWSSQPASTIKYDLISGHRTSAPYTGEDSTFVGPDGMGLSIEDLDEDGGARRGSRYLLTGTSAHQTLPLDDRRGFNFTGPVAHWSLDGRAILLGHSYPGSRAYGLSITDLDSLTISRYSGHVLASSAPWSPDGRRILVMNQKSGPPNVLDVVSGKVAPIVTTATSPVDWSDVVGWIDNSHVLVYLARNRRLVLSSRNVDSGNRFELVDVPLPTSQIDFSGVLMASHVVQKFPEAVAILSAPGVSP